MIFTIVVIVLSIIAVSGAVLLFYPFSLQLTFSVVGLHAAGGAIISFIHPAVVSVGTDFSRNDWHLTLFGRPWGKKKNEEPIVPVSPSDDTTEKTPLAEPEPPDALRETVPVTAESEPEEREPEGPAIKVTPEPPADIARHATPYPEPEPEPLPLPKTAPDIKRTDTSVTVSEVTRESSEVGPDPESSAEEKVVPSEKKKDNWFKRLERNRYLFFLRNGRWRSKVIRWLLRIIATLFHLVRFDRFRVAVRGGVSDPMITGTVSGMYQALLHGLPLHRPYTLSFEPVFMRNHFECNGSIRVRTAVIKVLMPVLVAVVTFPWIHTLWLVWCVFRRERRYRKEALT